MRPSASDNPCGEIALGGPSSGALDTLDAILKQTTGKGLDEMIEELTAEDASLDHLAASITEKIEAQNAGKLKDSFMLTEPLQLTVKRANKPGDGYSKRPHIGGESFAPVRCYAGKRNALIYVFKPLEVTDYVEMEMSEAQAKKALVGFELWLKNVIDRDMDRARQEAQQKASMAAERERLAGREKEYAEQGFGSW